MAVRIIVAPSNTQDSQWLKVDHNSRYIENHIEEWQFLFGPNSELTNSQQILKLAAEFDKINLDSIYFTAYLYNQNTGNVDNASSCTFNVYKIVNPNWVESIIYTATPPLLVNQHFYMDIPLTALPGVDFEGGDVIMMEAIVIRSGTTYRDRAYVNHLGVFDSVVRLRNAVNFLDITKQDL